MHTFLTESPGVGVWEKAGILSLRDLILSTLKSLSPGPLILFTSQKVLAIRLEVPPSGRSLVRFVVPPSGSLFRFTIGKLCLKADGIELTNLRPRVSSRRVSRDFQALLRGRAPENTGQRKGGGGGIVVPVPSFCGGEKKRETAHYRHRPRNGQWCASVSCFPRKLWG